MAHARDDNPFATPGGTYRGHEKSVSKLKVAEAAESASRTSESLMSPRRSWQSDGLSPTNLAGASGGRVPVRNFRGNVSAPTWARDKNYPACISCSREFTLLLRRHHCRGCGLIFCAGCTPSKMQLPTSWGIKDPKRVCLTCATQLRIAQSGIEARR
jgi:hypothetical protein